MLSTTADGRRFCHDCRWVRNIHGGTELPPDRWLCGHPSAQRETVDVVTGEQEFYSLGCYLNRSMDGYCNHGGKLWEARNDNHR